MRLPNERGPRATGDLRESSTAAQYRRRVDESRFCECGGPFVGRGIRSCLWCDSLEPRRSLRVREIDGSFGWLQVPAALARGGRP
jgi:hypothetical protein